MYAYKILSILSHLVMVWLVLNNNMNYNNYKIYIPIPCPLKRSIEYRTLPVGDI